MEDRVEAMMGERRCGGAHGGDEQEIEVHRRAESVFKTYIAPRVTRQQDIKIPLACLLCRETQITHFAIMADAAIKEWQDRAAQFSTKDRKALEAAFGELDSHLTLRSYIVGYSLTDADTAVWKAIRENHISHSFVKQGLLVNVSRWFKFIEETNPSLAPSLPVRPAKGAKGPAEEEKAKEEGGNFDIGLQEVQPGEVVVTRFPPEPS